MVAMQLSDAEHGQVQARMMWFFAFVYIAEGVAQTSGIIDQPLKRFLLEGLGWSTFAMSAYLWVLSIQWWAKPFYGLVSDCVPIAGYRRKSYLVLANLAAAVALFTLSKTLSTNKLIVELSIDVMMMATSSVLCGALIIEWAKHSTVAAKFCGQQSLWANGATIVAIFAGAWLCDTFNPTDALHWAAMIAAVAPLVVMLVTWPLVREEKTHIDMERLKEGARGIGRAVMTRSIWGVAGLLFLWSFNPGFGPVMYSYMRGVMHFAPREIGYVSACFAAGAAVGSLVYMKVLAHRFSVKQLTVPIIIIGGSAQLAFVLMGGLLSVMVLNVFNGIFTAMASVNAHTIAANKCPDHAEGFMYSTLLSAANVSFFTSGMVGGLLYDTLLFNPVTQVHHINPLIIMSAVITFACLALVRSLDLERPAQTAAQ